MVFLPTAPARIQPFFGYRNRERLLITARALRAREASYEIGGSWRAIRTMLAHFISHEVAEMPVTLEIARPGGISHRHQGLTDSEGFVRFDIALESEWPLGADPAWETVVFHWSNRHGPQSVQGHVLAPGTATGLAVISDIDDTIVETGVTGNFRAVMKNWRRVLAQMPEERLLVPGADVFYNALGGGLVEAAPEGHAGMPVAGGRQPATKRPFFYVSSSPWNLFSYLVAYIRGRGLPLGPIMLRDWGFSRATFGGASHGAHKRESIEALLALYPEIKFALIGDDSQGDLTAYAEVVHDMPERVRAIFIRKVGEAMTPEESAAQAAIEAAKVPLWLGDSYATGQHFLASIGLLHDSEAEKIVEAVDKPAAVPDKTTA